MVDAYAVTTHQLGCDTGEALAQRKCRHGGIGSPQVHMLQESLAVSVTLLERQGIDLAVFLGRLGDRTAEELDLFPAGYAWQVHMAIRTETLDLLGIEGVAGVQRGVSIVRRHLYGSDVVLVL